MPDALIHPSSVAVSSFWLAQGSLLLRPQARIMGYMELSVLLMLQLVVPVRPAYKDAAS